MIPFLDLKEQTRRLKAEVLEKLGQVMDQTAFCLGPAVQEFEEAYARRIGVAHAVAVNTGTSALHLALEAAGIGAGDEVLTVPMTFVATAAAIRYAGAVPRYVDVDPRTYTMDPAQLKVTPKTRAILPVHLYGRPAAMGPILSFAEQHGLAVIEDACQAHLTPLRGKAAALSFYPGKNLGAFGEGGLLVTNDAELAQKARWLRDWGQTEKYHHDYFGYNYRMDGFQGAVLGVKLPHLEGWTARRRQLAARYDQELQGLDLILPASAPDHVYHLYVIQVEERERVQKALQEQGVGTGIHYPIPVHLQKAYADPGSFPHSETLARRCLSLPMYPELTDEQQTHVIQALAGVVGRREWTLSS